MSTALYEQMIHLILSIPRGRVATYGQIARQAGHPRGARTVARVLHSSSRKHDLPWHRVVNRLGAISLPPGQGQEKQRALLRMEGVQFGLNGRIDLGRYGHVYDE